MLKRHLVLLFLLSVIIFFSCEQNTIVFPKVCTEEPDLPFNKVTLTFETDTVTQQQITLDKKGYLYGDNITIQQNGVKKNMRLVGFICKDLKLHVTITYNDTTDHSQLKIEGNVDGNIARADVLYCPNSNSNCDFVKIGDFFGSYAGGNGAGHFTTSGFTGMMRYQGENNP
jgi:hypothetical protein